MWDAELYGVLLNMKSNNIDPKETQYSVWSIQWMTFKIATQSTGGTWFQVQVKFKFFIGIYTLSKYKWR